jgi:hypothetical protein
MNKLSQKNISISLFFLYPGYLFASRKGMKEGDAAKAMNHH